MRSIKICVGLLFLAAGFEQATPGLAQQAPAPPTVQTIVIDPAHGGPDTGTMLTERLAERDLTLAISNRLRALLVARGFNVIVTHQTNDDAANLTMDQRAEAANHAHAIACLVVHATGSGAGVHLYTSALPELARSLQSSSPVPWDEAQAVYIPRSIRLQSELQTALTRARFSVITGRGFLKPIDNMTCPAVLVELGPTNVPAQDIAYQQHVAEAIAGAMLFWRAHPDAAVTTIGNRP